MNDERFAQLNDRVARLIKAFKDAKGVIDADLAADALAFVMAIQIDMDPRIALPAHIRKAGEDHGALVQRYASFLRRHFEATGRHFARNSAER